MGGAGNHLVSTSPQRPGNYDRRIRCGLSAHRGQIGVAVLALHAHRMHAFFEKTGLIDQQHGIALTQRLNDVISEVVAHRVGIPARSVEQVLHAVGAGVLCRFGQLLAVFALQGAEQPHQILKCAFLHFAPVKGKNGS